MKTPRLFEKLEGTNAFFNAISSLGMQELVITAKILAILEATLFGNADFKQFLETSTENTTLIQAIVRQVIDSAIQYRNYEETYPNESILGKVYTIAISDKVNSHLLGFIENEGVILKLLPLNDALKPFDIKIEFREFMQVCEPKILKLSVTCYAAE